MKLTVLKAIEINKSLSHLGDINDLFCSYEIAENLAELTDIISKFEDDRKKLIDKYVLKNEDGSYKTKGDQNDFGKEHKDFDKGIIDLIKEEIEISLSTFKMKDLKDGQGKAVKPPANVIKGLIGTIIVK